ncbi:ATP-grasp domain-containing protein [Lentibacillus sediminis]|uniref:ATP-grasp domain-containing protein n=1 Tax=Lentibacillus sediminis TaxID=1940529 RepID=UPI000C1BC3BA|nr:ATP-grasp domain-containing protein [Lentibacillus sediminis]
MINYPAIPNKIIVVGGNHHNALGIIRSLGEMGCKVFFITKSNKKSFVSKSKFITMDWYIEREEELINILMEEFSNEQSKPIIFPSDDDAIKMLDKYMRTLNKSFILPNIKNKEKAILKYMNKDTMTKLALNHGFFVPVGCVLDFKKVNDIEAYLDKYHLKYPCIVKPLQSIGGSKKDIKICNNFVETKKYLYSLKGIYREVIIQEYIEKEAEVGIQGISTINNKEIIIPGIIRKVRQSVLSLGSTTYADISVSHPSVDVDKITTLMKSLGYNGIFDMELILSKGKLYFIELNFRNGAYGYALTKAGINLPYLWCLDAINIDISNHIKKVGRKYTLMSEFADFRNVITKKLKFLKWLKQFIEADVYLILNKNDIKPFIYKLLYK